MNSKKKIALLAVLAMVLPMVCLADGVADDIKGLNSVLDELYDSMITKSDRLIGIGQGLAGFGALWYIAARVWKHLANAEPIDFYPLFRPFAIGLCIALFPVVLAIINGVMKPTVTGTAAMMDESNKAITNLLKQKEEKIKQTDNWRMYVGTNGDGDRKEWYKYTHPDEEEGFLDGIGNDIRFTMEKAMYKFRNSVKEVLAEILQVLFQAAALCINTLRTFQMVVMGILGPLVFGLAVFDGFQHSLKMWLARYINVFLWLPVANILSAIIGTIQENMIKLDIRQIDTTGNTFFSATDIGYLIFMLIGIVGYFTVPSVANYIVHAAGGGHLGQKFVSMSSSAANSATQAMSKVSSGAMQTMNNVADMGKHINEGRSGQASGAGVAGAVGRGLGYSGAYLADKLSGNKDK